jgi:hypothetical protein
MLSMLIDKEQKGFDIWTMFLQRKRDWSDEGIKALDDFVILVGCLWQVPGFQKWFNVRPDVEQERSPICVV